MLDFLKKLFGGKKDDKPGASRLVPRELPSAQFEPERRGASALMPRIKHRPKASEASRGQGASALRPNINPRNTGRSNDYHMVDTNMLHQRNLAMFHDSCDDTPSSRDDSPSYDSGSSGCGSD